MDSNPNSSSFANRSKQSANEGGVRTPIMYCWPGKISPQTRPELATSLDIYPTILAAAGAEPSDDLPGLNLLPPLTNTTPIERTHIFGEGFAHDIADLNDPSRTRLYQWVIKDSFKLLLRRDGETNRYSSRHPKTVPTVQLFDLSEDPTEEKNLAAEEPDVVTELTELIDAWHPAEYSVDAGN